MNIVLARLKLKALSVAKAIVAAVTPIITTALLEILTELEAAAQVGIAAAATSAVVWATPNKR